MIFKYVPQEILFQGKIYTEGFKDIPLELAELIEGHPELSKMQEPKEKVEPYAYLHRLNLEGLEGLINQYEDSFKQMQHEIDIQRKMGQSEFLLRNRLKAVIRLTEEFNGIKAVALPIIEKLRAKEARNVKRMQEYAASVGGTFGYTPSGSPSIVVGKKSVVINGGDS